MNTISGEINEKDQVALLVFHGIAFSYQMSPMLSNEEELQLTGYTNITSNKGATEIFDKVNEIAYRYYTNRPIRFFYKEEDFMSIYKESIRTMIRRVLLGQEHIL